MKTYRVNPLIIPRDIDGVYFLVDIARKDYYDRRQITSLNQSMYLLCTIMRELSTFNEEVLTERFKGLFFIRDKAQEIQIGKDVQSCIIALCEIGFIEVADNA